MLENYKGMFGHDTIFHVLKSLVYYEDAENNPDPIVIDKGVTWDLVKSKLTKEVSAFLKV